jgi:LuxR family maltose regulon positive regulatory protein
VAGLHLSAARWFRAEGAVEQAVQHLVLAEEWEELSLLLIDGLMIGRLLLEGGAGALRSEAERLPRGTSSAATDLVRAAVALSAGDAAGCAEQVARARLAAVDDRPDAAWRLAMSLVDALRACGSDEAARALVLSEEADRALLACSSSARGPASTAAAEVAALVRLARGVALLRAGSLPEAAEMLERAGAADASDDYPYFRARCLGHVAVAHVLQGALTEASRSAAQALVAAGKGGPVVGEAVEKAHLALALVALEESDAPTARQHLSYVDLPALLPPDPVYDALVETVRAGLNRMEGAPEAATARLLAAGDRLSATDPWLAQRLRAEAAQMMVATGRPQQALDGLGDLDELRADTLLVAAGAHAELGQDAVVSELLASIPEARLAPRGRVSKLLVEALEASRSRARPRSRSLLDRALRVAAPEGLRRPFRETGPAMGRLLTENTDLLLQHRWLNDPTVPGRETSSVQPGDEPALVAEGQQLLLVETLTPKELEVLGYLEELLTTDEIAGRMFVSVNTVRTHVRSVLRKLGVNRRNAAVRRARELGIVSA